MKSIGTASRPRNTGVRGSTTVLWAAGLATTMAVAIGSYGFERNAAGVASTAGTRLVSTAVEAIDDAPRGRDLSYASFAPVTVDNSDESAPRGPGLELLVPTAAVSSEEPPFAMFIPEPASTDVVTAAVQQDDALELSSAWHPENAELQAAPRGPLCESC